MNNSQNKKFSLRQQHKRLVYFFTLENYTVEFFIELIFINAGSILPKKFHKQQNINPLIKQKTIKLMSNTASLHASALNWTLSRFLGQHKQVLSYMWTVAINVGIFLATYRYRKYTMLAHYLIGFSVAFITLLFTFPIMFQMILPSSACRKRTHILAGYTIVAAIFLQVLLGILAKLLNFCKAPSVVLYYINKSHMVLGYVLTILSKVQVYYYIKVDLQFWLLLYQDCIFFFMLVIKKIFFPTLESTIEPKQLDPTQIRKVTSLSQILASDPSKDYCVFANYVYDLDPLTFYHPAGYQILQLVKNREVDRFIYGMFRAQKLPNLPTNSHTFKSFDLLGSPVACIDIPPPFSNMPNTPFEVSIASIHKIYQNSQIYQINFAYREPIAFNGYETLEQLGRYHSLTVNCKVTRLYTSVNFLYESNIALLNKLGIQYKDYSTTLVFKANNLLENQLIPVSERTIIEKQPNNIVPLLLKVYEQGTLPNLMVNQKAKSLMMSPLKGLGLCLAQLQKGTIMIIAGGTGLYPFSDLIDLLYKNYKMTVSPSHERSILTLNPILKKRVLQQFKFRLLFACQNLQDIHPITLKQMEELNNSNTFSSLVRIKNHQDMAKLQLNLTTEKFEDILEGELAKIGDLAKVWLCGPPNMAEAVCSYFGKAYQNKDILLIV